MKRLLNGLLEQFSNLQYTPLLLSVIQQNKKGYYTAWVCIHSSAKWAEIPTKYLIKKLCWVSQHEYVCMKLKESIACVPPGSRIGGTSGIRELCAHCCWSSSEQCCLAGRWVSAQDMVVTASPRAGGEQWQEMLHFPNRRTETWGKNWFARDCWGEEERRIHSSEFPPCYGHRAFFLALNDSLASPWSSQGAIFMACMTLKRPEIRFLPKNLVLCNEYTGVRFAMKDSKEMCNIYVYHLLLISFSFRDSELSVGGLWHYMWRWDHLFLSCALSPPLYQQFGMRSNSCWFKWICRVPLGLSKWRRECEPEVCILQILWLFDIRDLNGSFWECQLALCWVSSSLGDSVHPVFSLSFSIVLSIA